MSFDIIVLKPADASVQDISEVEDVHPIGSAASVAAVFESVFPNCVGGVFICGELYSVELTFSGDPVMSAHLSLSFGASSAEEADLPFIASLTRVCQDLSAAAFAVSDNSRLTP